MYLNKYVKNDFARPSCFFLRCWCWMVEACEGGGAELKKLILKIIKIKKKQFFLGGG